MAYLRQFPLDELKIDQMFVRGMCNSRGDEQIVHSVVDLAHNFELKAVAEGVEDIQTLTLLRDMGCDIIQGYYYSPALPPEAFVNWVKNTLPEFSE